MDPDHFEIRFMRESLGLKNFAVTYERFGGGWRAPEGHPHRRGHRHRSRKRCSSSSPAGRRGSSTKRSSISSRGPPCAFRPRPQGRFVPPERRTPSSSRWRHRRPVSTTSSFSRTTGTTRASARVRAACHSRPNASKRSAACPMSVSSSRTSPSARSANGSRYVPGASAGTASRSTRSRSPSAANPSRCAAIEAEVEPVRCPDGRLPEQRLDRREIAAMECEQQARRVEDRPVPAHRERLGPRLEPLQPRCRCPDGRCASAHR